MRKLMVAITAMAFASCGDGATQNSDATSIDLANLDTEVSPKEDFYQYATGGWQKNNPLKDEYARYGAFDMLRENNEERIKELFTELSEQQNDKGSVGQKITDLYNMGLDTLRLNDEGAEPINRELRIINAMRGVNKRTTILATMHREVTNPLFGFNVGADLKNSTENILYISQGGLSMGNRDYYLDEKYSETREKYKAYIEELFILSGYSASDAKRAAQSVLSIETQIAEASSSNVELRDTYANYNMMDIESFKRRYRAIDWEHFASIMEFKLPTKINVKQPKHLDCVNSLLQTLSLQEVKDLLMFKTMNAAASYLSDDFSNASFAFYGTEMSGTEQQQPRWKRSLAIPNSSLGEAVGEMYVAKYFPAEYKTRMISLVDNLKVALSQHISSLDWMGSKTKKQAQDKLASFTVKIGYPDKWKDYSSLSIDPSQTYWANIKAIRAWRTDENLAKLYKPVDKTEWGMSPQTVNAYYSPTKNEICFPAAILQPPFFNPTADDAINYGAIGVVIGHEMTHGFDDTGRQFDKYGNLSDWWSADDADAFKAKSEILVEQYNQIEVLPGMFANGAFTLGENIADQGGLRVAYTAMKAAQKKSKPVVIDGFTAEQRFYLGYATVWAQNVRDKEIILRTNTDSHSLGKWRVNQALKNIETFYEAFDIAEGDAMYVAPKDRVVIW